MRKPSQRETVYLVVLVAIVSGWLLLKGGDAFTGGGAKSEAERLPIFEAPVVELARLETPPDEYDVSGRNLFQYGPAPRREPPPRVAPPPPPPRKDPPKRTPPRKDPPKRKPPAVAKRQPPRPDFDYLGYLGPKDDRIAVFEEKKREEEEDPMILARTGDVVQKNFLVVEFKYETVVLGYTDEEFEGQTTELQIKSK